MSSISTVIKRIKDAGFGYVKVELEADLGREYSGQGCSDCYGERRMQCSACGGEGAICTEERIGIEYRDVWEECADCYGDGEVDCTECENYVNADFSDEEVCDIFIKDYVSQAAREALIFGEFYEDGSVDSEFTFTVAVENVKYITEYIDAFKEIASRLGNSIDVDGAGMHLSVLPTSCGGRYPVHQSLEREKIENFKQQVTKLLPALFFLASSDGKNRGLGYRIPRIAHTSKYSAIYTHDRTCLEYRLFETCYERPEAVFEYLEVIANTLRYYADPTARVPEMGRVFGMDSDQRSIGKMFNTPDALRVLNKQLSLLKPSHKTHKELKSERGVLGTVRQAVREQTKIIRDYRKEHQDLAKRAKELEESPLNDYQKRWVDEQINDQWTSYTEADRPRLERQAKGIPNVPPLTEYVNNKINTRYEYSLAV